MVHRTIRRRIRPGYARAAVRLPSGESLVGQSTDREPRTGTNIALARVRCARDAPAFNALLWRMPGAFACRTGVLHSLADRSYFSARAGFRAPQRGRAMLRCNMNGVNRSKFL